MTDNVPGFECGTCVLLDANALSYHVKVYYDIVLIKGVIDISKTKQI